MSDDARKLIRSLPTARHLALFAVRLRTWLLTEPDEDHGEVHDFSESRARALLRAADAVDDSTLSDFARLTGSEEGLRVSLHDLLDITDLALQEEVRALTAVIAPTEVEAAPQIAWLSLILVAHAWRRQYPVMQLDPSAPPERFSPAGHVVAHTAAFLRQQIQRSATDRDRMARRLAYRGDGSPAGLEELRAEGTIPPLPPHFRPPIPVRYPEVSRETLQVEPDEQPETPPVTRGESIVITEDDISDDASGAGESVVQSAPIQMPAIRISRDQVQPTQPPSPMPPSAVVMPTNASESRPGLAVSLRQRLGSEELTSTKLRVVAQEYPDGPGLYGLQVKVSCKGIKSYVAGTTDREGRFLAELPVRQREGLTYDVDLTWPRELGGETERKSLTLHADRTEFVLPFYLHLEPQDRQEGQ